MKNKLITVRTCDTWQWNQNLRKGRIDINHKTNLLYKNREKCVQLAVR